MPDDAAYWCHSCCPDGEFGDVMDRMEQDIVCAFVAAAFSDEDICEDISECVHAECAAFFGREQARQHGVHMEKVCVGDQETTGACRASKEKFDVHDLWTAGPLGW